MSTNFCDINTTLKEWATVVNSTIHFGEARDQRESAGLRARHPVQTPWTLVTPEKPEDAGQLPGEGPRGLLPKGREFRAMAPHTFCQESPEITCSQAV